MTSLFNYSRQAKIVQTPLSVSAGPDTDLTLCEIFWFVMYPWGNFTDETLHALFDIECFHSRGQRLCKFIDSKESVCMRKELNSHRTGLGHQHGRHFIVFGTPIWPPWRHVKLLYMTYSSLLWILTSLFNRPLPSSINPHFQNEANCATFCCENEFNLHENEKSFPY